MYRCESRQCASEEEDRDHGAGFFPHDGLPELIDAERTPRFDKLLAVTSLLFGFPGGPVEVMGGVEDDDDGAGAASAAMTFHFSLTLLNAALCATLVSLSGSSPLEGAFPPARSSCWRAREAASLSLSYPLLLLCMARLELESE